MSAFYAVGRNLSLVLAAVYGLTTVVLSLGWRFLAPERSVRDLRIVFGWPVVLFMCAWHGSYKDDEDDITDGS